MRNDPGQLEIVLADYEPVVIPVHLVHGGQTILLLKLRAFLDYSAPRLREALHSEFLAGPGKPSVSGAAG